MKWRRSSPASSRFAFRLRRRWVSSGLLSATRGATAKMRGGNFMKGMQGFMALHQRTVEADFAAASRREAERMRIEIASAQASGVLGNGRLANLHDARSSSLLNPNGLFLGALHQRLLFSHGAAPLLTYARAANGTGRPFILPTLPHCRQPPLHVPHT